MKHTLLLCAALTAAIACPATYAKNTNIVPDRPLLIQGGPGIVTSVSATQAQLPKKAQEFLQTVYSRDVVGPIKFNTIKDTYSVEIGNGTRITFTADGRVDDIQAPYGDTLYGRAIQAIVPEKTYKHLEKAGLLDQVTGI